MLCKRCDAPIKKSKTGFCNRCNGRKQSLKNNIGGISPHFYKIHFDEIEDAQIENERNKNYAY